MKFKASFPRRVCILWLNWKISSACAVVRPDVKTERPTCTPTSCPAPEGGASVGTETSAPKPWLAGADPLRGSKDAGVTELRTGRLGAAGGIKNDGEGGQLGESGCLRSRDLQTGRVQHQYPGKAVCALLHIHVQICQGLCDFQPLH